jgi:hypothetical protein
MCRGFLAALFALSVVGCNPNGDAPPSLCVDPGFTSDQLQQIDEAIDEWNVRGGVRITERVGDLDKGDCTPVRPTDSLPEGVDGRTHLVQGEPDSEYILLSNSAGQFVRESALHEIGHLLTGAAHSADERDIMFAYPPPDDVDGGRHLTDSDLARLNQ